MDITSTTAPKSDQQNYDDYVGGPKTVTVTEVKKGSADQPVEVHLAEFPGRPYKPSKSMRRVLVAAWGADASAYAGRRITLYGDPTVRFGGQEVGGIRIGALSNIDKPLQLSLTVTRGKRAPFVVQPIRDEGVLKEHLSALTAAASMEELVGAWEAASVAGVTNAPQIIELKDARKAELADVVEDGQPE